VETPADCAGDLSLLLSSIVAAGILLPVLGSLEWQHPLSNTANDVEAIRRPGSMVPPGERAAPRPSGRVQHNPAFAQLYRQGPPCPLVVSGGDDNPSAGARPAPNHEGSRAARRPPTSSGGASHTTRKRGRIVKL